MGFLGASITPATVVGALIACVSQATLDLMSTTLTCAVSRASGYNDYLQSIFPSFKQISR